MTETAYVCRAYAVTDGLDTQALHAAWRAATFHHDLPGGGPAGPGDDADWFADLGTLADPRPWEAAERLWAAPSFLSFPAGCGPAALLTVARTADGGHLVLLAVNRTFAADRSLAALVDEVAATYATATCRAVDFETADFDWDADLTRSLAALCAQEKVTPPEVLLTAYQCLLVRHGAEDGVAVGVRGMDDDHLVVRADLSAGPPFRELLRRTAALTREASARRTAPFQRPAEGEDPDTHQIPPCDAMFVLEDPREAVLRLPDTRVRRLRFADEGTGADLTLTVHRTTRSLSGSLEYRTSPFDPAAAAGLLGQLRTVLSAALDDPGAPADTLPLEAPERIRAALRDADLTAAAWTGRTVNERVRAVARSAPDALALAGDTGTMTYRELSAQAARITGALRTLGVAEGAPVALLLPNGPRQAAVLLGVLDAGAHVVCLGSGHAGERGRAVLAELRPHCLVLDGEPADSTLVSWYQRELGGSVLDLDALPDVPPDTQSPDRAVPGAGGGSGPSAPAAADRWAYVAYTSGSTGHPKGIPQTHRTLAQFIDWFTQEFGIEPGSRVAQWAAPGYDAGLVELFAALTVGATLCPVPLRTRAHPEKLADWLEAERITHFQTVPSFARQLLAALGGTAQRLGTLDGLLLAGEALPGELADGLRAALPSTRLVNLYGATETILATWHDVTGPARGAVPIGRSIPGRQVLVLDQHDRPCPTGVTGRIVVCGPHVTPGYVGTHSSDEAFRPVAGPGGSGIGDGPCYRSGDLGRRRWDGQLEFKGRGDSRIKIFGTRLELTDVEAALAAEASVVDCAVIAHTGPDGLVTRLVAYVVPHRTPDGEPVVPSAVWRAALRRWFGKAMPPVLFVTPAGGLPRNTGGKVDLRALADLAPSSR